MSEEVDLSPESIEALASRLAELIAGGRAVVATLLFAGPRADELCGLLWRDIDLDNRRISIGRPKAQAGLREIIRSRCCGRSSSHTEQRRAAWVRTTSSSRP